MKKTYLIFLLSVSLPLFLKAQQKPVIVPGQQPVSQKPVASSNPSVQTNSKGTSVSREKELLAEANGKKGISQPHKWGEGDKHKKRFSGTPIYGNEWINYSQYYYKIKVPQNGIYRIDSTTLAKAGVPVGTTDSRKYQLFFKGQQQYIFINSKTTYLSEKNGDYIEFYGQYNDGTADSLLYYDINFLPNPYYSLFNDSSTYYLTWNSSIANFRMKEQADTAWNPVDSAPYVIAPIIMAGRAYSTAASNNLAPDVYLQNATPYSPYSPGAWIPDGEFTPNDPRFTQNATWTDTWIGNNSSLKLTPAVGSVYSAAGAPRAFLRTVVLGLDTGYCTFTIASNIRNLWQNVPCNAFAASDMDTTFPATDVASNGFYIRYANNNSATTNIIAPTYFYLTYPHKLNLTGDTTFAMSLNDSAAGPSEAYLHFTTIPTKKPTDTIRMYDLTNHNRFWVKRDPGGFKVLAPSSRGLQQCFITSDPFIHQVKSITPVGINANGLFTNFSTGPKKAFIIITHPSLWTSAQAYATYRSKRYGTAVADVEELYDQFGEGVDYSPLGIRRFCNYAIAKWGIPSNLFLIGKGIHTPIFRSDTAKWSRVQLLVPSYGYPSSDILFTNGLDGDSLLEPAIPTGRLAAATPAEVNTYLNKVETYESAPAALWMKNVVHFAGGSTPPQENLFASFLDNYAITISDTLFGARVYFFEKSTPAPLRGSLTDSIINLINNGVSIMTFFGHASGSNWDESVDYPSEYQNYNKYPFMMADACFSGDIYQPIGQAITSVSEQWVLTSPGAIGFLASDYLGNPSQLYQYTNQIYNDISYRPFYRKPIGEIIQNTIDSLQNTSNEFMICTLLEVTLHGDPAIGINAMDSLPDYAVNNQSIYFTPSSVSDLQDSFKVNVIVYNYGEALNQTVPVTLTRTFPSGRVHPYTRFANPPKYPYLYYTDTVSVTVPVNDSNIAMGAGLNYFTVSVDLTPKVDAELTYANNSIGSSGVSLWINSEDITPVWPYDYAIIPTDTATLKASTNDPFAPQRTYIFEIDTSHSFNSPLFRSDTATNSGGVIKISPYADWVTTHFHGPVKRSSGNAGNKITVTAPVVQQNVAATVQNTASAKLVEPAQAGHAASAVQNNATVMNQSPEKMSPALIAKQATMPQNIASQKTSSVPMAHSKHGPINESFINNAVYYWRVRRDTADSLLYPWVNTSFQYIKGKIGWGQSNFFQYDNDEILNDSYNFINFNNPPRGWSFNNNGHTLQCFTFGMINENVTDLYATEYILDNFVEAYAGCQISDGIYVAIIDKTTLQPWTTAEHPGMGNANCPTCAQCNNNPSQNYFIFWDDDFNHTPYMENLIRMLKDSVPAGDYILAYTYYEGAFKAPMLADADSVINEFVNLGATLMPYHATTPGLDSVPWIFFVQKGNLASAKQVYGATHSSGIQLSVELSGNDTYGAITTPLIGPAAKYDSLSWFQHPAEKPPLTDSTRLNIIGIEPSGNQKTLMANVTPATANFYISSINPVLFPYIQLMLYTKDAVNHTPGQMNWWRVFYQPVPEIAMNPNVYTYYHADTLQYGDKLNFQTTVQNISDYPIASTQLLTWTTDKNNNIKYYNPGQMVKPLNPGDTAKVSFIMVDSSLNTTTLKSVWFEVNPLNEPDTRLEQYHFNNYAEKSFYSYGDKINPVLDVTFNGLHILNNDIVAPQPNILVTFMDENKFLALNNPNDFKVYLNPVGSPAQLVPYGPALSFTPASEPHNKCSLLLTPTLPDGTYQLTVQGTDISGNLSANNTYTVDFQVINKSMISQVLNYPNPFSTSTRFVFILTGEQIPTIFKIQIMTVSGKIVREITENEIGPIHIGRNITQYAWDGTDQYGAKLANGVYLYRVVTSINGQSIDEYENYDGANVDKYFTKGWGKMYLMR